jgi:hypothetical protein
LDGGNKNAVIDRSAVVDYKVKAVDVPYKAKRQKISSNLSKTFIHLSK